MNFRLSPAVKTLQPSATIAAAAKAKALKASGVKVFDFTLGEPDFNTPAHIRAAATAAMDAGHTHYTPSGGIPELKSAIIHAYQRDYGLKFEANQIIVGSIYDVTTMNGSFDIYLAERAGPPVLAQLKVEGVAASVSAFILANNTLTGANKFVDEGANTSLVAPNSAGAYPLLAAPTDITAPSDISPSVQDNGSEPGSSSDQPPATSVATPQCARSTSRPRSPKRGPSIRPTPASITGRKCTSSATSLPSAPFIAAEPT